MSIQSRYVYGTNPEYYTKTLEAATRTPADRCFRQLDRAAQECGLKRVDKISHHSNAYYQKYEHTIRYKFLRLRARWLIGVQPGENSTTISVSTRRYSSIYLWAIAIIFVLSLPLLNDFFDDLSFKNPGFIGDWILITIATIEIAIGILIEIRIHQISAKLEDTFWPRMAQLGPWLWSQKTTRSLGRYRHSHTSNDPVEFVTAPWTPSP